MIENLKFAWEEFKKRPIVGLLFIFVIGLGFVYIDLRKETTANKKEQSKMNTDCQARVRELENTVTFMLHEKKVSDSSLSALNAQWKLMQKLGLIKLPTE